MATHTLDEVSKFIALRLTQQNKKVRKKRLARLGTSVSPKTPDTLISAGERAAEPGNHESDVESLMDIETTELSCYEASSMVNRKIRDHGLSKSLAGEDDPGKKKFCDAFSRETQLSRARLATSTQMPVTATADPYTEQLTLVLRILSAQLDFSDGDPDPFICLPDEQVTVRLLSGMRPNSPPDLTDTRSFFFDFFHRS